MSHSDPGVVVVVVVVVVVKWWNWVCEIFIYVKKNVHKCSYAYRNPEKHEIRSGVGGVRMSIHQSWLVKRLGLLCWGFKGVQEEIPREEASTLQIESVAFPPGQCTSPQLHPCHRLFNQDGHQHSSSASL